MSRAECEMNGRPLNFSGRALSICILKLTSYQLWGDGGGKKGGGKKSGKIAHNMLAVTFQSKLGTR